jgi:hypothetical protein
MGFLLSHFKKGLNNYQAVGINSNPLAHLPALLANNTVEPF